MIKITVLGGRDTARRAVVFDPGHGYSGGGKTGAIKAMTSCMARSCLKRSAIEKTARYMYKTGQMSC